MKFSKILTGALTLLAALSFLPLQATSVKAVKTSGLPYPSGHGTAGAYIGAIDPGTVIMAGGSDFETLKPWEGGSKTFFSDIYVLTREGGEYGTSPAGASLPRGMGNGCAVVYGKSLYCLGGLSAEGYLSDVICIGKTAGGYSAEVAGKLPDGFRANAAALYKNNIYVHGTADGANALYRFSPETGSWTRLAGCPGRILSEGSTFV